MHWFEPVWLYCERGTSTDFLAEPVNALSTLSIMIAGFAGLWIYRKLPASQQSSDHLLLIALTFITSFGGLAFHLFATQWSEILHLLPLLLFVLVYLALALNRFLKVPPGVTGLMIGGFVLVTIASLTMTCSFLDSVLQPAWSVGDGAADVQKPGATSCLNGSFAYFPSLFVLLVLTWTLRKRRHKAAKSHMFASFLLIVALVFHTLDHLTCTLTLFGDHNLGVHFVWHLLSAASMFILLRSAMLHQGKRLVQEIIPPDAKRSKNI